MPKYSYKCLDCGCLFDIEATLRQREESGKNKFVCFSCGSKRILPQFSPANFVKNIFADEDKGGDACCGPKSPGGGGGCCG